MTLQYDLNNGQIIVELTDDDSLIVSNGVTNKLAKGTVVAVPNVNTVYSGKYAIDQVVAFKNSAAYNFKEVGEDPTYSVINETDIFFSFQPIVLP